MFSPIQVYMVFRTHSAFYGFGIPTIRSSVMWTLHPVDGFGYHLKAAVLKPVNPFFKA